MARSNVSSVTSTIGPFDVLLGRSRKAYMHTGNKAYRTLIKKESSKYKRDASRAAKTTIVVETFETIKAKGGRFLRFSQGDWSQVSDRTAKQKVGHSLRDAVRDFQGLPRELDDRLSTSTATPGLSGNATTLLLPPPSNHSVRQYVAPQPQIQPPVSAANHSHQYCSREQVMDFNQRTNGISMPMVDRQSTTEPCRQAFPGGRGWCSSNSHFFHIKDAMLITEDPILLSAPNDIQLGSQEEASWFSCCENENFDIFAGCEQDPEVSLELVRNLDGEQELEGTNDDFVLRQLQQALELCDDLDDDLEDDEEHNEENNTIPWLF